MGCRAAGIDRLEYVCYYDYSMNINIVSTTELQRNIKKVLEKLNSSSEPMVVVRDSVPAAVMLSYSEYKRLSSFEKEILKEKMMKILDEMAKNNKNVSDKELNEDIKEAIRFAPDYSWLERMIGSIKIKDKKTVRISENVDEIYYR